MDFEVSELRQLDEQRDEAPSTSRRLSVTCPVCTAAKAVAIDAEIVVPVLMNRTYQNAEAARTAPREALALTRCGDCGFVWNRRFDPARIVYDRHYENDQTHSRAFVDHLNARARDVAASVPASTSIDCLEIGCGQARFMQEIDAVAGPRLRSLEGFDPAWRGRDGGGPGGARIHRTYFDTRTASRLQFPPNVVVSRHTIEHVHDPVGFLRAIRAVLGPDSDATIFVETPCVDWILARQALQDFCYEHCSLFTAASLALALERAGFGETNVTHVFGGQYLWAQARGRPRRQASPLPSRIQLPWIDATRAAFIARWRAQVESAARLGPVALWGAATKGVTFSLLVDPEARLIDHIVDINPAKQARHVAMTGLPVLSPQDSVARRPRTVFVMNPNYLAEIADCVAALGGVAKLIPIN